MSIRKFLSMANSMAVSTKQARQDIKDEGKTKAWENRQFDELLQSSKKSAQTISANMLAVAEMELQEKTNKAKNIRVKPNNNVRQADSAGKLYQQNLARMAFDGLNPADAIEAYPRLIGGLTEQERKEHLHVWEDVLINKMRDEGDRQLAEMEVFKHKPEDEQQAIQEAQQAAKQFESVKTAAIHFEHDIEEIATGKRDHPGYDYNTFLDEPKEQTIEGMESFEQSMKPTPYDQGIKEHH